MRLRHIEIFHAVYLHGSISEAARTLNVSQPSVSKVLRHAEDQLGYNLFDRVKGRLLPTEEAHSLFVEANEVYSRIGSLNRVAKNIKNRKGGHIRLAVLPSLGFGVAPDAIAEFRKQYPDTTFEIDTLHSKDVARSLYERDYDLAIGFNIPEQPRLVNRKLGDGSLVVLAPRGHFGESESKVSIKDLENTDFIGLRDSGPSGDLFTTELLRQDVNLREIITARTYYIAMTLVSHGAGIAVVDEFTANACSDAGICVYPMARPISFSIDCVMLTDSAMSGLCSEFMDVVERSVARVQKT